MTHIDIEIVDGTAKVNIDGMEVLARDISIAEHFYDDKKATEIHMYDFSDSTKPLYFSVEDTTLIQEVQRRASKRKSIAESLKRIVLNICDLDLLIKDAEIYKKLGS